MSVQLQECRRNRESDTLVTVDEGMVLDEPEGVGCGKVEDLRLATRELVLRPRQRGIEEAGLAYAGRPVPVRTSRT